MGRTSTTPPRVGRTRWTPLPMVIVASTSLTRVLKMLRQPGTSAARCFGASPPVSSTGQRTRAQPVAPY